MATTTKTKISTRVKTIVVIAAAAVVLLAAGGIVLYRQQIGVPRNVWCIRHPKSALCKNLTPGYLTPGYNK